MRRICVLATVLALVTVIPAAPVHAAPPTPGGGATVTLITGDRVTLYGGPDGEPAVAVRAAPGREGIGFLRSTVHGAVSVVPADALRLLNAGRLDPRLFDVTSLVRQGYAGTAALPVIIKSAAITSGAAATVTRGLPSIGATAVRADTAAFWPWFTRTGPESKVWLDGRSRTLLDQSVPQIGAPAAWQAGYTGAAVTVGILDSGVKADHPDLAGKVVEARDFTGTRPDAGDDAGHGTHVAGIIAGTGAASGGKYRGVAPDAKLVSGKVCDADGYCTDSAVIAGMEWIAPKVRMVNMSLGGRGTDGTDPVSQALNTLAARYGTLFVVAAGNSGQADQVGSPASADAALAVGSVTKQDATSYFSSRGPRLGDYAVKPDVAAPGSDIVSARAAGTPGGDQDPVGADYVRLSGTSMAAPHVAGAAAILAQQHPDWSGARFKPVLMSTATPTADVLDQGAGRIDVARAVGQRVTTEGGSLSFGAFRWPRGPEPVSRTVTYRNDGDAPVTLTLGGLPAPFTVAAGQVTVPAHGTAGVAVSVTPAAGAAGQHQGRLTATAPGVTVRTAVAAFLEPESYPLTVRVTSRTASPDEQTAQVVDTSTGEAYPIYSFDPGGVATVRLPRGHYDVNAVDISKDPDNQAQPYTVTVLSRPGVDLAADTTVTLDATAGRPVRAVVDRSGATRRFGELGLFSGNPAGDRGGSLSWFTRPAYQLFAVSTPGRVTDHTYAFFHRVLLDAGADVYHLAFLERGRIPASTTYRVRDRDLATVDSRYPVQGAPSEAFRADYARLAVRGAGSGAFEFYPLAMPGRRVEYYTANPDVTWLHILGVSAAGSADLETNWSVRSYRPGRQRVAWNSAPLGPAFGSPANGWVVAREGKNLKVALTVLSGSDPNQYTTGGVTGTTTISRDGVLLGTSQQAGSGQFAIPDTAARYTLRVAATRSVPWSVLGTRADVAWTFREPGSAAPVAPLPLLVVRTGGAGLDDQGRAPAGCAYPLVLTVQHQPGAAAPKLASLRVAASFDDGATWRPVPVSGGRALVGHPARAGFVSLRISATDAAGNSVEQTVIRAYQTVEVPRGHPST